jgi:hypothetical protein
MANKSTRNTKTKKVTRAHKPAPPKADPPKEGVAITVAEKPKPETNNGEKRTITTLDGVSKFNKRWPSFSLLELVRPVSQLNSKISIHQRKTTVFLKHPDHKFNLVTFFRTGASGGGMFSKKFTKRDGAAPDTLGLMTIKFKDLKAETDARGIAKKAIERFGIEVKEDVVHKEAR